MARKQKPPLQGLTLLGWDPNASVYSPDYCPGCRKRPDRQCACCGADTAFVLPAGKCALTLCRRCHTAIKAVRIQAVAERTAKPRKKRTPRQRMASVA